MTTPAYADLTHEQRCELLAVEVWKVVDPVVIYSGEHGAFWGPNHSGYGGIDFAGVYNRADAEATTKHCGPEKQIAIRPATTAKGFDPYNNLIDHGALRDRMDEQGIVKRISAAGKPSDSVTLTGDSGGVTVDVERSNYAAERAAICEAYGRLKGLWWE